MNKADHMDFLFARINVKIVQYMHSRTHFLIFMREAFYGKMDDSKQEG